MNTPSELKQSCAECRFYVKGEDEGLGTCHRYAPKPLVGGVGTGWSEWEWPPVAESDFCGEFFPRWKYWEHKNE